MAISTGGETTAYKPRSGDLILVGMLALFIAILVLSTFIGGALQVAVIIFAMACALLAPFMHRMFVGGDLSFLLLVPTIFSATQNMYLMALTDVLTSDQVQFLVIVNYLYSVSILVILIALRRKGSRWKILRTAGWSLALILLYSLASYAVFGAGLSSALASLRNITTPFLFLIIGLLASKNSSLKNYTLYLSVLGFLVILFGFVELWVPRFWQDYTNLAKYWEMKDLPVSGGTGLPPNYWSSEEIGGQQLRRMVSSFADPVNLGTFMFAVFMAAWFGKHKLVKWLAAIASVLILSKGALLGFLVFWTYWTRYFSDRVIHVLMLLFTIGAACAVYLFTLDSSTGSTTAHINGFLASFEELPAHILGRGLGNSGVLAGLFDEGAESTSGVRESGFGVVISQLGIVGLAIYAIFFIALIRACFRVTDRRERMLAVSLTIGFMLNAAFNEVALSPNSAATYFIMVGLVLGHDYWQKQDAEPVAIPARRPALR